MLLHRPLSAVTFPEELPISARVRDIAAAIHDHPVVVVAGETGSGKTTQLPKIALAMGRGLERHIAVTQPRRIAATSVAARVAQELDVQLGSEVGYHIRFAKKAGPGTYVKFMTDGILLAELSGDPLLRGYDTIVIDEAHERSLNIDFLLGVMKQLLPRRPDLRVIISSATLETRRFSDFFGGAPVIEVSGRTFPVETFYRPPTRDEDLADAVANTVEEITEVDRRGDVLVFLPGEREIREAASALEEHALPHTEILPLYGRLSQADQQRVFTTSHQRRIVLATNVAETSLTIPGIVYVVDTGLARINRYVPRTGVTQLLIEPIAQASADQRKGRAGRTRSGVCFRLYEQQDFEGRPRYTDPELLRVGLAGAILQMKSMGLGAIESFPFLDPPPRKAVEEGYRVLDELGALDAARGLTPIGQKLARLPVDPRIGRMILGGHDEGALREVLVIAAALGLQDPRERPLAAQQKADMAHRRFRDESSDFNSLLRLWRFWEETIKPKGQSAQRRLCRENFLSYVRMREWSDVHQQLVGIARELDFKANEKPASDDAVHRALLPGLLSKVAMWSPEQRAYVGARQTKFLIHPSSALAKKPPPWIIAAEIVETSQLFGRTAAKIDPEWLEAAGKAQLRRSHGETSWAEKQAEVMIRESVTLYGLPIIKDRRVRLGPIDPVAARRLFILHALVRQEWEPLPEPAFVRHNREVFEEVRRLRARARKSDMLADDDAVAVFFEQRVPEHVHSGKTFDTWRKAAEATDPRILFLSTDDVLQGEAVELSAERFPESLVLDGARFDLVYRFDPGADDDGITMEVPLPLLGSLDPDVLAWTIPGWLTEQVSLLLHWLPKAHRKDLGAIDELAKVLGSSLRPFHGGFRAELSRAILALTGVKVPDSAFDVERLPPHLRLSVRVLDGEKVVAASRDVAALQARFVGRAKDAWSARGRSPWEKEGLTTFGDPLLDHVTVQVGGQTLVGHPALVDAETSVAQRLFPSRAEADAATRGGLRRLFLLRLGMPLSKLEQQVPARVAMSSLTDLGVAAPRRQIVERALDEAFGLSEPATFPRDRKAFDLRFEKGRPKVAELVGELGRYATAIVAELDPARTMLAGLAGKPGAPRASLDDVASQLEHLVPADLLSRLPRARLVHVPRYLKGIQVRLERMPNGPQKDLAKAEQVAPLWRAFLRDAPRLRAAGVDPDVLEDVRWLIEELRIAVFAPELKTPVSVSPQRLAGLWKDLAEAAG